MPIKPEQFREVLKTIATLLQREGRVSYRSLKQQFELDDDDLEHIKDELIYVQRDAYDENGRVLVWAREWRGKDYTPRHLADQVLKSHSSIESEKKQVTVLFCDVVESMKLADKLGAENWHYTLSKFFAILTSTVHGLNGTINQFTGDGIMALFGAPLAVESHARCAGLAALNIVESIRELNSSTEERFGISFRVRIGLNSGEVVVGRIGDDLRMDYTAQGQVVGIAARLENLATPNTVLMSESTMRQLSDLCRCESLGPHQIKGVDRPVEVYRLLGIRRDGSRFDTSLQRGLTPFVGRGLELRQLQASVQDARSGRGRVVGVIGEAGIGKSRLCHEFLRECRAQGMIVLSGQALPHGKQLPYLPLLQVFRGYFSITDIDSAEEARAKIRDKLLSQDAALEVQIPVVCEFLEVADPSAVPLRTDPDAKQRQLITLLRRIVQRTDSTAGRFVTFIEDLHWLDAESEKVLSEWVDAIRESSGLLLVTYRPDYEGEWMDSESFVPLRLDPLAPDSVHQMLHSLLGDHASNARLAEQIYERTGGNPFFCEQIVQSLRESGTLNAVREQFHLNQPLDELELPASIQALLSDRIDRLEDKAKRVLQFAAVIGRTFSLALLRQVATEEDLELASILVKLEQAGFIHETTSGSSTEFEFRHALTHEVALNSQLQEKRRHSSARVARAIESFYADRAGEMAALAAFHWEKAGEVLPAALALQRAAAHIGTRNRKQEMIYVHKILDLTANLPHGEQKIGLRLQALATLIAGGAWRFEMSEQDIASFASEAIELAEMAGLNDLAYLIRSGGAASMGMMRGANNRWGQKIDAIVAGVGGVSTETMAALNTNQAYSRYARGLLLPGLEQALAVITVANGDCRFGIASGYSVLLTGLNIAALNASGLGRFTQAYELNQKGRAMARANNLIEEQIWHGSNLAEELCLMGLAPDHAWTRKAVSEAESAHELAEQVASDFTRGVALRGLAISHAMAGRHAEAMQIAERCLELCRGQHAHLEAEARVMTLIAEMHLEQGDLQTARLAAREAIDRAAGQGAEFFEAMAQLILARTLIALKCAPLEIEQTLAAAATLIERTRSFALRSQWMELSARVLACSGDAAGAIVGLGQALEAYRQTGASGHASRLAAEIAESS